MAILKLILFAVLLASGQILFKKAALVGVEAGGDGAQGGGWIWSLLNPWMAAALLLYGAATVLWVLILRTTPLSTAYPFAALGFVLVPLAGHFLFDERIGLAIIVGSALIVAGVLVIAAGGSS